MATHIQEIGSMVNFISEESIHLLLEKFANAFLKMESAHEKLSKIKSNLRKMKKLVLVLPVAYALED